jgi:ribonuclease HII
MDVKATGKRAAHRGHRAPTLTWERKAWGVGKTLVAGVDEVGRGAWAGPLTAAAVLLPADPRDRARLTRALNVVGVTPRDSKQLTREQRERAFDVLLDQAIPFSVANIPPDEIDSLGLGVANRLAMCRAVAALEPLPEHVLIDAFPLAELHCTQDAIIRGDATCVSIALASIVAKVQRDALMLDLDRCFPEYGFAEHKGYGTAAHAQALAQHGPIAIHRYSFAPIAALIADG